MPVPVQRWRFTAADFERMARAGIFEEGDRVELIDGEVCAMSPIGPRHAAIVRRLNQLLSRLLADQAIVSVQNPVRLNHYTEPQPDLTVLRPREDFYAEGHPEPADVYLVVEVAETSLEYDREVKVPRYAEARIPEFWLIDLEAGTVVQYSQPVGSRYAQEEELRRGQTIGLRSEIAFRVSVDEILG